MDFLKKMGQYVVTSIIFFLIGALLISLLGVPFLSGKKNEAVQAFDADRLTILTAAPMQLSDAERAGLLDDQGVIPASRLPLPTLDSEMGELTIERIGVAEALYYGKRFDQEAGVKLAPISSLPGEAGATLIEGKSIFGELNQLAEGDQIKVTTYYGEYLYQVREQQVLAYQSAAYLDAFQDASRHTLMLSTGYPLKAAGMTDERYVVTAELVSGPLIDANQ